jgi:hypothetical protein
MKAIINILMVLAFLAVAGAIAVPTVTGFYLLLVAIALISGAAILLAFRLRSRA